MAERRPQESGSRASLQPPADIPYHDPARLAGRLAQINLPSVHEARHTQFDAAAATYLPLYGDFLRCNHLACINLR